MSRPRKIAGTFCRRVITPKRQLDPTSFRWIHRGQAWILVACPRGSFTKGRCRVGMRAHEVLAPSKSKRCPIGQKRIRK